MGSFHMFIIAVSAVCVLHVFFFFFIKLQRPKSNSIYLLLVPGRKAFNNTSGSVQYKLRSLNCQLITTELYTIQGHQTTASS